MGVENVTIPPPIFLLLDPLKSEGISNTFFLTPYFDNVLLNVSITHTHAQENL